MTVSIAVSLPAAHLGRFSTPRPARIWLTGPIEGLKIMFQTAATATSEATYGKNETVRKKLRHLTFWFSSMARPRLQTSVSGTVPTA